MKPPWLKRGAVAAAALAVAIQLVPYGRDHANPPVDLEPPWNNPQTRALAVRACFDCHSNQTVWPWYSHVAPVSWLVYRDTIVGRQKLNFSQWQRPQKEAHEAAEAVQKGEMPMAIYLVAHPEARLTPAETAQLVAGLEATIGQSEPISERD